MPQKSDLQQAQKNWNTRIQAARSAGIPDRAWKSLMTKDFQSIALGHSPMANKDVNDAIMAAAGRSPITDPQKGTSWTDIVGNIPSDIQGIVSGFPAGIAHYVTTLPEQLHDFLHMADPAMQKKYGMETGDKWSAIWDDPAGFVRDLSREPLLGPLVPGLHTAAAATSATGREELAQHPVSAAIDVGAALSSLGKLGVLGEGANVAEQAAKESAGLDVGRIPEAVREKMTPMAALQRGEPYRAAGRAALDIAEKVPFVKMTRQNIRETLLQMGIHPDLTEYLSRPWGVIRNFQQRQMNRMFKSDVVRPLLQMQPERRELFNRVMSGQSVLRDEDKALLSQGTIDPATGNPVSIVDEQSGLLTDAGRAIAYDPNAEADIRMAVQKQNDNEIFNSDLAMQEIGKKAREHMEKAAYANPNLRYVRSYWNRSYWYQKGHPVALAYDRLQKLIQFRSNVENDLRDAMSARLQLQDDPNVDVQTLNNAIGKELEQRDLLARAQRAEADANKIFRARLDAQAPAAFAHVLDPEMRAAAGAEAERQFAEGRPQGRVGSLDEAMNYIQNTVNWEGMTRAIGEEATTTLRKEVEATWSTLAKETGVDPLYMPNTAGRTAVETSFPTIMAKSPVAKASYSKKTAFNLSHSTYDVAAGVMEHERQRLTEWGTAYFAENWVKKFWTEDETDKHMSVMNAISNGGGETAVGVDARSIAMQEVKRNYKSWDPEHYGFGAYFPGGQYVIHKSVEKALDHLMSTETPAKSPFTVMYDRGTKVWRFSVLTTPRHLSHILLGGAMMGIIRDPLFPVHFLQHFSEARAIMHGDNDMLLAKFGGNVNDFEPDQIWAIASGKTMGRLTNAITGGVRKLNTFEENATLMYKITEYLANGSTEEGLNLANKMFVDMNAMTPWERAVVRKIFPFYGFTRHLFRYLMTMPADHPLTSAILTNFANQHWSDWNSGLPQAMSWMFFLGSPDANGKVTGVDYRSIDPFRSFYNDFTIGGFFSQLNPATQLIAQQAGVNVLSGTPELYPNQHYDPSTGTMVADQPGSIPLRIFETIFPQANALDAWLQLSDQYRNLKVTDPEAFQHRVYTTLGIPFAPEPVNIPRKVQTAQMKRYRDAQTSINQAIQTGDFTKAQRYAYVPVPSLLSPWMPNMTYATPKAIENIYRALEHQVGQQGVSLHAILPKPSRPRTR